MRVEDGAIDVLRAIAGLPTAPLHERAVARHLAAVFAGLGVPLRRDRAGNLLGRVRRGDGARPLALVAHMDHPGVVVTAVRGGEATARVLGGLRPSVLAPGTGLLLQQEGWSGRGEITACDPEAAAGRPLLSLRVPEGAPVGAAGMLDLPALRAEGDLLLLRAADDLAQCAAMVLVARCLVAADWPVDVSFVFTRAEEIGLIGATLLARSRLLPDDAIVLSLECSRALPGAELGGGPVIRVGDARQSFHPQAEALLLAAREELRGAGGAAVQRQLLTGGACEASAFLAYGYVAGGAALPLEHYHNAGPDGGAAAERIHRQDLLGEVELLVAAARASARPPLDRRPGLEELAGPAADGLAAGAAGWDFAQPLAPASRRRRPGDVLATIPSTH